MPLRRILGRLRRGLSTATSLPPWAMIYRTELVESPATPGSSFHLGVPPRPSTLFIPNHLVDLRPCPDPDGDIVAIQGGMVTTTSGDGLLLLDFTDTRATAPIVDMPGGGQMRKLMGLDLDPDIARFICNPLSGQLFRLPDIDGTKKTASSNNFGVLTRSARGQGPPDRYVVAELSDDRDGEEGSFVMRRFFSETGVWEKLVGLPSPLPLTRQMDIYHEVLAFDGRLWWVDLSWGAVSADPFSDRPELSFIELPSASVQPVPSTIAELAAAREVQGVYRRMGVSQGRLCYVEVSQKLPFLLSSFVLDGNGSYWTLEHQMPLGEFWVPTGPPPEEHFPRIAVVDPLNSSLMYVTIGHHALACDMVRKLVRGGPVVEPGAVPSTLFFKPCVLPPWLGSSRIPSAACRYSQRQRQDFVRHTGPCGQGQELRCTSKFIGRLLMD